MHILHASHAAANTETIGFDIENCVPACSVANGVFDLYATKANALRLAVDAAITVLMLEIVIYIHIYIYACIYISV
jgi:chaperonin GroEL (HSP60 family)